MSTPWSASGKVDKSGPDKNLSAHGRKEGKATGMEMQGPTPKSGSGYKALGHMGNEGIGNPMAMSSDRSEMKANMSMSKPSRIEKSATMVPKNPVKWHKKGYDMSVPADLASGKKIAAKMKAH